MARFSLGLGLVLTVCMAATRPSSAIRAGSPDSSRWWETKDFAEFTEAAAARRLAGDFAGLESVYTEGYQRATALGNQAAQISYLSNLGTARMLSLRYAPAVEAYLEASRLAERTGDWSALGGIAVNLSWVYQRLGDPEAALSALERGKTAMDALTRGPESVPPSYKAQLLIRLRSIRADLQESPTEHGPIGPSYLDAIQAARQTNDPDAEASAWNLLGQENIAAGNLEEAEAALGQALRLRTSHSPEYLSFSYAALGELRLGGRSGQWGRAPPASQRGRGLYRARDRQRSVETRPLSPFPSEGSDPRSAGPTRIGTAGLQDGREPSE